MIENYYNKLKNYLSLGIIKKSLVANVIFSYILYSISSLLIPYFAASIVDYGMLGDYKNAFLVAIILLVAACIYLLCSHYRYGAYHKSSVYIHNKLESIILKRVTTYDEYYTNHISKSRIINTAYEDLNCVMEVMDECLNMASACLTIIGSVIILTLTNAFIGLLSLILNFISIYRLMYNMNKRDIFLARRKKHQDDVSNLLNQVLDGNKEINAFNMEDSISDYLSKYKKYWKNDYKLESKFDNRVYVTVPTILGIGKIFIYLILVYLILNGELVVSSLILVIGYYENIQNQFSYLYTQLNLLTKNLNSVDRVKDILTYHSRDMISFGDYVKDKIDGKIELIDVSYKVEDKVLIKDINHIFKPNTLTSIVGDNNSGKTTLFKLILRLNKVSSGKITLDDIRIYDYMSSAYAKSVSLVSEDPFIFDMSIRENLSLIDSNFRHQIAVCRYLGIHNEIKTLENDYNTKLFKDAENISVELKIMLSIARTLLSNAKVILVDDIFKHSNHLDITRIKKILHTLKKDHTIIVITNNEAILDSSDEIIWMSRGKIKKKG